MKKRKKTHEHYWFYEHMIYDGRPNKKDEIAVRRYCKCGVNQMAYSNVWHKPSKNYKLFTT